MKHKLAMALSVLLLIQSIVFGQGWTNLVIPSVDFRQVSFSNALESVRKSVNTLDPDLHLEVRYDFRGPDSRYALPATNPIFTPVQFRATNMPAGEVVTILCEISGPSNYTTSNAVLTIRRPGRGYLFLSPQDSYRPGIYSDFDRRMVVSTNIEHGPVIADVLGQISKVTQTDIILEPDLNQIALLTGMHLPETDHTAFEVLKACVITLRHLTRRDLTLYAPNFQQPRDYRLDLSGGCLAIGERPKHGDVRNDFPLYVPDEKGKPGGGRWHTSQNSIRQYREAMELTKEIMGLKDVFYESELNAYWVISDNPWWFGLDYYNFGPPVTNRVEVSIGRDGSVTVVPIGSKALK